MNYETHLRAAVEKNNPYQDKDNCYERQCFRRGANLLLPLLVRARETLKIYKDTPLPEWKCGEFSYEYRAKEALAEIDNLLEGKA